ncbi:conserved hypothetical protein [Ricinus communis]|uniref:Uncharacterized protein n=1 Tax=Ricinus communis TaxID=3988 RepID=B9SZG7_RICCO|nr:conserved hypothetical protein [Ricinus communis]
MSEISLIRLPRTTSKLATLELRKKEVDALQDEQAVVSKELSYTLKYYDEAAKELIKKKFGDVDLEFLAELNIKEIGQLAHEKMLAEE